MALVKAITSHDNPLLVRLRKLARTSGGYRKSQEIWIEGDHLCSAYVQRGGIPALAVVTDAAWEVPSLRELVSQAQRVAVVPSALMVELSTLESPASMGFVVPWRGGAEIQAHQASLVLDRLQDAGNVGALMRSAAAFGFHQILALKGTVALWSPKVLRAGMGAHFGLHLVEGIREDRLSDLQLPLLAASPHATLAIHQVILPWPCAWVLGHEGQGVSEKLLQICAKALKIPQPGGEESLNVAAAAVVCMYESARQNR